MSGRKNVLVRAGPALAKKTDMSLCVLACGIERVGRKGRGATAWTNTQKGSRPIVVRGGFLQGACEGPVAFALALRVALAEVGGEVRKQEVQFTTEFENWYVDDITIATTAEHHGQNLKRRSRNVAWSSETTSALLTAQLQKEQPRSERK